MGLFGQNLKFALRQLVRNPGFTVTVILTLALSIGANTAIFSIVNALMIRTLPYVDPERIGAVFERVGGARPYDERTEIDGERWELLRDQVPALTAAVSGGVSGVNLQAGPRIEYLHAGRISQHYLDVLGIQPLIGRNFTESEDLPDGARSAILSYRLWRNTFNEDRNLVGQPIRLKGESYTVVGVLPDGATTPLNADIYTALQPSRSGEGEGSNFELITRLKDGANWQQADAELARAWASWVAEQRKQPQARFEASYYFVPLKQGQSAELRPKALVLMLASAFILLIACANLAGLTLVRMARRSAEVATRLALGASRWQIQRQLWIENLVLALAGGVAGLGVGFLALRGLLSMLPEGFLPIAKVPLDWRVLAFTLLVSVLTSVLFGMLPAFATRKVDLRSSIASRTVAGGDRLGLRQAMIAGEVALTVVLLAASGLLIRTLIHLETLPPGFNAAGVMTAKASLDDARYHDPAAFNHLLESTVFAMKRIPGVSNAAVGLTLPYERTLNEVVTLHDGQDAGKEVGTDEVYVTPGYFDTLQIPLLAGRDFRASDGPDTQPVVIVNRAFANKFFRGANPIGHTLNKGEVIVGVVGNVELSSGLDPIAPLESEERIYIPATQLGPHELELVHTWYQPSWIVRTAAPVNGLPKQMQRALASADPGLPFSGFYSMMELEAQTLSTQRMEVALVSAMGALALLLSTVGIFALVASTVAQRTREIGIRIALGSSIAQAMVQVAGSGVRASIAGLVAGLVLCVVALGGMRSVLYGVGVYDGPTMGLVVFSLLAVSLVAASLPVLRIARINPATTLRDQ